MPSQDFSGFLRRARRQAAGVNSSDAELLERWRGDRDQLAFEMLVGRHGSMVFGVCRRILGATTDAEDVFQAVFLTLVRKGDTIRTSRSVGSWLYRVAFRLAVRTRARRKPDPMLGIEPMVNPDESPVWNDLREVLDEEINRLPSRYRDAFVMCYLQGKTNEQAARELQRPLGTILSRLSTARQKLRGRLERRGVFFSLAATACTLTGALQAAVPTALVQSTVSAAVGTIPATAAVSAIVGSATTGSLWVKAKVMLTTAATMAGISLGTGLVTLPAESVQQVVEGVAARPAPMVAPAEQLAVAPRLVPNEIVKVDQDRRTCLTAVIRNRRTDARVDVWMKFDNVATDRTDSRLIQTIGSDQSEWTAFEVVFDRPIANETNARPATLPPLAPIVIGMTRDGKIVNAIVSGADKQWNFIRTEPRTEGKADTTDWPRMMIEMWRDGRASIDHHKGARVLSRIVGGVGSVSLAECPGPDDERPNDPSSPSDLLNPFAGWEMGMKS